MYPDKNFNNKIEGIPSFGFMRLKQVLTIFPISKSAWWAGVKEGRFPQPVKISARTTCWKVSDIRNLVNELGGAA